MIRVEEWMGVKMADVDVLRWHSFRTSGTVLCEMVTLGGQSCVGLVEEGGWLVWGAYTLLGPGYDLMLSAASVLRLLRRGDKEMSCN